MEPYGKDQGRRNVNAKNCMEVTCRYYSAWLGQDGILLHDFKGIRYVRSEERNRIPYGYGAPVDLYVFCQKKRLVVSYGDRGREKAGILQEEIQSGMAPEEIRRSLERIFERRADHSVKYVLTDPILVSGAAVLAAEDYDEYESFWKKRHPESRDVGWLKDYFLEMVQDRTCVGAFVDGMLVSCTDAPGMPYLEDEVQEIGINTLPEYRGKGYASAACRKCLREILQHGKAPQWSAPIENAASRRLAEKVGFTEFAEVISMTL